MFENKLYENKYYRALNNLLQLNVEGENILFLGCHPDNDARLFLGKDITILEPINSFVEKYENEFKAYSMVKVIKGRWEDFDLNRKFDCVVCTDCIEHSKQPFAILERLVKHSDIIIITCPNSFWKFLDRSENHGHGRHISFLSFKQLESFFRTRNYKTELSRTIRHAWLGKFGFGIFLDVRNKKLKSGNKLAIS